jgi:hypothetical protein
MSWAACAVQPIQSFCCSSVLQAEYRNEIFYPPYWYDFANKPNISAIQGESDPAYIAQLFYDQEFTISWSSNVPVTNVTIVAPSTVTHCFNTNQRVVVLPIVSVDNVAKSVTVKTPPNINIAVPQFYMLFLLNGKTYGSARWIQLQDISQFEK